MSGHSKWSQIKHQKGTADQKRGALFSKLLSAISVAAKTESNPQFNPRLRTAIEKAKENNVPQDKIESAVKRALQAADNIEELLIEAYGPEGVAILIEATTDSRNRSIAEIKKILSDSNAKLAEPGSVLWTFEKQDGAWLAKFNQEISESGKTQLQKLIEKLEEHSDIQKIITNSQ
ncbi:MAG: YebC/PmpR family DNA-binding transcriptional regulator [Patescibacteria group bacterium]